MPSRRQEKGYRANAKAVQWLYKNGFTDVYLKPHGRFDKDIYELFDGICFSPDGTLVFIQVKSNAWPKEEPIIEFLKGKKVMAIAINAIDYKGVSVRVYHNEINKINNNEEDDLHAGYIKRPFTTTNNIIN